MRLILHSFDSHTTKTLLVLSLILVGAAPAVWGATYTSKANGDWNNAATWNCTGSGCSSYPSSNDAVTISSGTTINLTTDYTHGNSLTVNGTLTLKANLTIQGNNAKLTVNANGKVQEEVAYYYNANRSLIIDAGSGSGNGSSANFTDPGLVVSGIVEVSNLTLSKFSWSTVTGPGTGTINYGGTIYVKKLMLSDTQSNLKIDGLVIVAHAATWDTGNQGANIITTGSGAFSVQGTDSSDNYDPSLTNFCASVDPCATPCVGQPTCQRVIDSGYAYISLPITLISFKADYNKESNCTKLEWLTANEENNDFYTIERSSDALHFEEVLQLKGAGTTHERRLYTTLDTKPLIGTAYYRLKQTDLNGDNTYSKIVSVQGKEGDALGFQLSPNPAIGSEVTIRLDGQQTAPVWVMIHNQLGQSVYAQLLSTENESKLVINLEGIAENGLYSVRVQFGKEIATKKLLIANR